MPQYKDQEQRPLSLNIQERRKAKTEITFLGIRKRTKMVLGGGRKYMWNEIQWP